MLEKKEEKKQTIENLWRFELLVNRSESRVGVRLHLLVADLLGQTQLLLVEPQRCRKIAATHTHVAQVPEGPEHRLPTSTTT